MTGSSIALNPRSRSINLEVGGTAVMLKCVAQHQCRGGWCGINVETKVLLGGPGPDRKVLAYCEGT